MKIVFVDRGQRPDVDNVLKRIADALKGIVYIDDRQLSDVRSVALRDDSSYRTVDGMPHETIRRLFDSGHFLIRVHLPSEPSILRELRTS